MTISIRKVTEKDRHTVLDMMRRFYSSAAVYTNGSDEIFNADINACLSENPCVDGYVFENGSSYAGYAMLVKSFSTEFGKQCIWIEDLYVLPEYRSSGIGSSFLSFISDQYKNCIFRLEAEEDNTSAVKLYRKHGFEFLPYSEMIKL